jgi:cysteine desulfurase/selenocysteine lyase
LNPAEVRELFPILQERTYLFSGGHSPASTPALEAVQRLMGEWADDTLDLYGRLHEEQDEVRRLFAGLIGADMDEVAVLDSTGSGENLAVEMIPIPARGNVVFDEWSYPSAVYPWMLPPREHLERRWVMSRGGVIELDDLEAAVDDDTVAVSISHVTQGEGFRQDLGAVSKLAHAHGALLLVDAAQSAGAVQIDAHAQGDRLPGCWGL